MSAPKRGLGRGLDALLGERAPRAALATVPVDAIRPNPRQPRQTFDAAALAELEQSIRELGVLVPIIVRPLPGLGADTYELIAGERRWRASAAAGLATIPAIVREVDDRTSLEVAVVENLQRQDLDALEEAMGFAHLIDDFGFTQERLAERIGRSRPSVANALRLLALADPLKALLRRGVLSVGHARALLALPENEREAVAKRIERENLTVRDVEQLGERRNARTSAPRPRAAASPDFEAAEARLRYALGASVKIVPGRSGGRIEVRYADLSELTRIVDAIVPEAS